MFWNNRYEGVWDCVGRFDFGLLYFFVISNTVSLVTDAIPAILLLRYCAAAHRAQPVRFSSMNATYSHRTLRNMYNFSPTLPLKGQCHQIFLPLVFFFKQLLLAPVDKPSNDFDFFRIFAEIFDYFGASPVSAMHALPVSLTPVNNSSPVSTTPVSDTLTCFRELHRCQRHRQKIPHRCHWHRRSTGKVDYLRQYSKIIEIVTRLVYWGQEKLFEEKNQRRKIWWHCSFKGCGKFLTEVNVISHCDQMILRCSPWCRTQVCAQAKNSIQICTVTQFRVLARGAKQNFEFRPTAHNQIHRPGP